MRISRTDIERYERAFKNIEGLASVVRRLIQEVEVLKTMLRDKGLWDENRYKNALVQRFIDDHNSAGAIPILNCSDYNYVLDEISFLAHRFNFTDEDLSAFKREVDRVSCLT